MLDFRDFENFLPTKYKENKEGRWKINFALVKPLYI